MVLLPKLCLDLSACLYPALPRALATSPADPPRGDMYNKLKRLFSESSVYTLGNILMRSFSIITMPVFTRCMSTQEYGVLSIVRTVRDLLAVIYEVGTPASSMRFYYDCKTHEERELLFSTLFFLTTSFGICVSLPLLILGAPLWEYFIEDIPFRPYGILTLITVLLAAIGILPRTLFRAEGKAKRFVMLNLAQMTLIVSLSLLFVMVYRMEALGPILGACIASAILYVVYLYYLYPYLRFRFSWTLMKKALLFGLPDSPVRLGNWALKMANQLILQRYVALAMVGVYAVGYAIGSILFELVINGIHWAVLPFYYQTATDENEEEAKKIFAYVTTYNFALILLLALATIMMGKELLFIFGSSRYITALPIVHIIALSSVLQFLFFIPSRSFYLMKKTVYLIPLLLITTTVNIVLCLFLIPHHGIIGAAWATMIAYGLRTVLAWFISQALYPINYQYTRMMKNVIAFGIVIFIWSRLPEISLFFRIIINFALMTLYPLSLFLMKFFEKEEMEHIKWQIYSLFKEFRFIYKNNC